MGLVRQLSLSLATCVLTLVACCIHTYVGATLRIRSIEKITEIKHALVDKEKGI